MFPFNIVALLVEQFEEQQVELEHGVDDWNGIEGEYGNLWLQCEQIESSVLFVVWPIDERFLWLEHEVELNSNDSRFHRELKLRKSLIDLIRLVNWLCLTKHTEQV